MIPYEVAYEAGFEDMARRIPDISAHRGAHRLRTVVKLDEIIARIADHFRGAPAAVEAGADDPDDDADPPTPARGSANAPARRTEQLAA